MKLTKKSQTTLDRLISKADIWSDNKTRMPKLTLVHDLLNDLNIDHTFDSTYCSKTTKSSGSRYSTGGGSKMYNGYKLTFKKGNVNVMMDTTDTYYSWNSHSYAQDIVDLIKLSK